MALFPEGGITIPVPALPPGVIEAVATSPLPTDRTEITSAQKRLLGVVGVAAVVILALAVALR